MQRNLIIKEALEWLGTPYVHQASCKNGGCDCLGLLIGVWNELRDEKAETPPPYSSNWAESGGAENLLDAANRILIKVDKGSEKAGDVLIFRMSPNTPAKHCGILLSNDKMIHSYSGHGVVESYIDGSWSERIVGRFRFPWIEG
jgi:NlpC/P60 family putative phage cell wall peptidase